MQPFLNENQSSPSCLHRFLLCWVPSPTVPLPFHVSEPPQLMTLPSSSNAAKAKLDAWIWMTFFNLSATELQSPPNAGLPQATTVRSALSAAKAWEVASQGRAKPSTCIGHHVSNTFKHFIASWTNPRQTFGNTDSGMGHESTSYSHLQLVGKPTLLSPFEFLLR